MRVGELVEALSRVGYDREVMFSEPPHGFTSSPGREPGGSIFFLDPVGEGDDASLVLMRSPSIDGRSSAGRLLSTLRMLGPGASLLHVQTARDNGFDYRRVSRVHPRDEVNGGWVELVLESEDEARERERDR